MPNAILRRTNKLYASTIAAGIILTAGTIEASADGAAVLESWAGASDSAIAISYGNLSESGSNLTVTDFEVRISLRQIAETITTLIGEEMDEADAQKDMFYNFKLPSVTFNNLRDDGGRYAVDKIDANSMQLEASFKVPGEDQSQVTTVSYEGFTATNLDWAKVPEIVPDETKPVSQFVPVLRALVDVSFDNITMLAGEATSNIPELNGAFTQQYGEIRMDNAVNGDIASISGGPILMTLPINQEGDNSQGGQVDKNAVLKMQIGSFSASDYNYGTMMQTLFAPAGGVSNDVRTMLGSMSLNDWLVSVPDDGVEFTMGRFVMEDIGVKSPQFDWLAEVDALAVKGINGEDLGIPEEELALLPFKIYSVFSMGKFEIADIRGKGPEIALAKLDAYGMTDLSSDGLGSFYMRGVDFAGEKGEVIKYGEFSFNDVKFPDLKALIAFEKNVADKNIQEILKAIPIVGSIVNSGIKLNIPDEDVEFSMAKSEIVTADHIGPVPTSITIDIDDFSLPVDAMDREQREVYQGLGYDRLEGSYDMRLSWDEATSDLTASTDIELANGGRLTGETVLGSIPRLVFERPDETAVFSLLATTFKSLNLRYDDSSLVNRAVDLAAKESGTDAASIKAQVMAMLPIGLAQLNDATFTAKVSQAIGEVLENGSSLNLSAIATTPLPVIALVTAAQSNPASLMNSIEIDVGN